MNIIWIVLRISKVCILWKYFIVISFKRLISSNSNTFICSLSLYSHHYVSLFHFSPFPLPGSYPRNINPDFWICIFPQNIFHGKKYVALYVYSPIEPGSHMARAPTRASSETVGAPRCSIPLEIWLAFTVLKGHWDIVMIVWSVWKCTCGLQIFSKM